MGREQNGFMVLLEPLDYRRLRSSAHSCSPRAEEGTLSSASTQSSWLCSAFKNEEV